MDNVRFTVALLAIVVYPSMLVFWFLVHPFVRYWRKVGPALTYTVTLTTLTVIGAGMYSFRNAILAIEYGTGGLLIALSVVTLVIGLTIEVSCRRQLSIGTLVGLPELASDGSTSRLLQEGIYGRVRHPRYLGAGFGVIAVALFANYLATYIVAAAYGPLIYLVTVLEETELVDRLGDEYRRYQRRIPRFVPSLRS